MKKKSMIFAVISVCLAVSGIGTHYMLKTEKKEEVENRAEKIAVINLDEGVFYNHQERFFAKEFLSKYSDHYVVTGLGEAKAGLENGKYCAYMIIPSEFSKHTVSINQNPQKSLLRYELSSHLSSSNMQYALSSVTKLKDMLSRDMSYLYVYDIFHEFHQGQSQATQVLKNEKVIQDSLNQIQQSDLLTALEIKPLEQMQTPTYSWDIQPFVEENNQMIQNIQQAYQMYLSAAEKQLTHLQDESQQMNRDYQEVLTHYNEFQPIILQDDSPNYQLNKTEEYITQSLTDMHEQCEDIITQYLEKEIQGNQLLKECQNEIYGLVEKVVETYQQAIIQKMLESLQSQFKSLSLEDDFIHVSQYLQDYKTYQQACSYIQCTLLNAFYQYDYAIQTDKEVIVQEIEEMLLQDTEFVNALEVYKQLFDKADLTISDLLENLEDYQLDMNELNEQLQLDVSALYQKQFDGFQKEMEQYMDEKVNQQIESYVDEYVTKLKTISIFSSDDLKDMLMSLKTIQAQDIRDTVKSDLESLDASQKEIYQMFQTLLFQYQQRGQLYMKEFLVYDPLQYVQKEEIDNYQMQMIATYMKLKKLVEDNDHAYWQFIQSCYDKGNETIDKLYQTIIDYQRKSDLQISQALENAKTTQDYYLILNQEMMNEFIHQLSETKRGTLANESVYDFIVSPVELEEK